MTINKINLPPITEFIEKSEGCVLKPYKCSKGFLTIGVGRNLEAIGLRLDELTYFKQKYGLSDEDSVWAKLNTGIDRADALYLLGNDLTQFKTDIKKIIPYFAQLPSFIQYVLLDMIFNMGAGDSKKGLKSFKKMLAAIGAFHMQDDPSSLDEAAVEMLDSAYLADVKTRAVRNAMLLCNDFAKVKRLLASRPNRQDKIDLINKYGGK